RYENVSVRGAGEADIDEGLLWSFVREFEGDAFEPNSVTRDYPTGEVLKRELLLAAGNMDLVLPTVAGLLLFGRDERVRELLPRASVTAVRYAGDNAQSHEIERVQIHGNLHTLYESVLRFVARYCDLWDKRPSRASSSSCAGGDVAGVGGARGAGAVEEAHAYARANYQRGAVEEAVANALAHRDLALRDRPTRVHVFDRSIEFVNARRTAGFAPPAQRAIRYGIPQRLNPQTLAVFTSAAYGLKLPHGGLPALLRRARLFSGRRPEIHAFNDEFRLRLFGV
ncbi:MAG: hypothetical protein ABR563_06995, partial [Pyrinomonadaceae bacterium]